MTMFEFFFKYTPQTFEEGAFVFTHSLSLVWLVVFLGIAIAVIGYFLYNNSRLLAAWQLFIIGFIQICMVAVVLLAIWQPAMITEELRQGDNVVAVMLDTSESMAYGEGESSRITQAQELIAGNELERLEERYPLKNYIFSNTASELEHFGELPEPGDTSRLGDSLLRVLRSASNHSLGGIILFSDGADSQGSIDPEQLKEIISFNVPVHTVGVGREKIPEDLELLEVLLPQKVLPGSTLSARISIRHDAAVNARVKVYDGDTFVASQDIQLNEGDEVTSSWLEFDLSESGYRDLQFSIDPLPEERNLLNNTRSAAIEIPEETYRILYMEGEPRWEYKFMRRALEEDSSVHLETLLRVSTNKYYRQGIDDPEQLKDGFPETKSELYQYHAVIIGSIEAAVFTPEQQQILHDFVSERGGSVMLIAGPNGLGNGGWQNSRINDLLPAGLTEERDQFVREKVSLNLTPLGRNSAVLKMSEDLTENDRLWSELPEVADYHLIGDLRPAASALLSAYIGGANQPILVTQPYGRGHSYIMATGGTWRWQMSLPSDDMRHETFWRQLARAMVVNTPQNFQFSGEMKGNQLALRAELRKHDFEPENDLAVTAVVTPEHGVPFNMNLNPVPGQPGIFEAAYVPEFMGLIEVEAISRRNEEPLQSKRIMVHNESDSMEYFNIRQNRSLLERLSDVTQGHYWHSDDLNGLNEAVRSSRAGFTEQTAHHLWDAPFVFFLLLLLKSIEWLLRRSWGTI